MKTKIILSIVAIAMMSTTNGQKQTLDLTFTAIDSAAYVHLDSIKVMNRTQGGNALVYWPDTTLTVDITPGDTLLYIGYSTKYPLGILEINQTPQNFQVFQNYPNPVKDHTSVSLDIPEKGTVNIMVTDLAGRRVISGKWLLDEGHHSFRFNPGNGNLFFLTARWKGMSKSIKIFSVDSGSANTCSLDYIGCDKRELLLKAPSGTLSSVTESGILDAPVASKTYTFQFATNIPCLGIPTVSYEGHIYNTIQIFSQCWLKENLNVGTMIPGTQGMSNNSVVEKYCYKNYTGNCDFYGGLYQWNEMMQYDTAPGVQGICPPGWHLPTDEEWRVLEGAADSQYGIGDSVWDNTDYNGYDAGINLKTTNGWWAGGDGNDLFGFSGMPGGGSYGNGSFDWITYLGVWWSSTQSSTIYAYAWRHSFDFMYPHVLRYNKGIQSEGFSVRCLKNY